ncbi:hypothetical protein PC116_g14995 [Phytophthora cactorum]|nr:hypothetical protein PC120_g12181 [Phytophthora cactorum]KAG3020425.1 hypothetical protein PC119_g9971 [Phytophthora cactorum]KAG4236930.1 hypothetical protein PC116_g14995 [Phytophthora cactorum]
MHCPVYKNDGGVPGGRPLPSVSVAPAGATVGTVEHGYCA